MFPGDCGEIEEARIEVVSVNADALEGGSGGGCMVPSSLGVASLSK